MSHFARVKNNIVTSVIVAEQDFIDSIPVEEGVEWIQTSRNTRFGKHYDPDTGEVDDGVPLRGNFAVIGWLYNKELDVFHEPQPYPSWTLNSDGCWNPPHRIGLTREVSPHETPVDPTTKNNEVWNEEEYQKDPTKGWTTHDHRGVPVEDQQVLQEIIPVDEWRPYWPN